MRILTVVGARPQIIKAAQLSPWLVSQNLEEILVHSGQHFSKSMSETFFQEFGLQEPKHNLGVNQVSRTIMISSILEKLEPIFAAEKPEACLVYGDTNTTLAGALAANFSGVPLIHVEAGLRSGNLSMPEETNRILTDQLADLNLAPNQRAMENLRREGCRGLSLLTGDIMLDGLARTASTLKREGPGSGPPRILVTIHREEITQNPSEMQRVMRSLSEVSGSAQVRVVRHPRIPIDDMKLWLGRASNVEILEPLGHREVIAELLSSSLVITDSGGLQREAVFLGHKCLILRGETEWDDLLEVGSCELVNPKEPLNAQIIRLLSAPSPAKHELPKVGAVGKQISAAIKGFLVGQKGA